uniref:Uncharacterized protein n=1 Tax=Ditylenchus dipsaci TaxID=166011 RepID=A0A915DXN5_9BILA
MSFLSDGNESAANLSGEGSSIVAQARKENQLIRYGVNSRKSLKPDNVFSAEIQEIQRDHYNVEVFILKQNIRVSKYTKLNSRTSSTIEHFHLSFDDGNCNNANLPSLLSRRNNCLNLIILFDNYVFFKNLSACFQTGPKNSILNLCPSVMTEEQLKQRAKSQAHRCKDPVERFKYICLSNGLTTIKNLLRSFERDGITLEGFIAAINNCGLHLSNEDAKLIFAQISKDQANLSIDDFVIAIQPSVNSTRTELIEKAFKLVANGKEFATVDDLKTAYNYKKQPQYLSGQKTKEEITEIFLKLFDARSTKME